MSDFHRQNDFDGIKYVLMTIDEEGRKEFFSSMLSYVSSDTARARVTVGKLCTDPLFLDQVDELLKGGDLLDNNGSNQLVKPSVVSLGLIFLFAECRSQEAFLFRLPEDICSEIFHPWTGTVTSPSIWEVPKDEALLAHCCSALFAGTSDAFGHLYVLAHKNSPVTIQDGQMPSPEVFDASYIRTSTLLLFLQDILQIEASPPKNGRKTMFGSASSVIIPPELCLKTTLLSILDRFSDDVYDFSSTKSSELLTKLAYPTIILLGRTVTTPVSSDAARRWVVPNLVHAIGLLQYPRNYTNYSGKLSSDISLRVKGFGQRVRTATSVLRCLHNLVGAAQAYATAARPPRYEDIHFDILSTCLDQAIKNVSERISR
jgi:hypothetical protein